MLAISVGRPSEECYRHNAFCCGRRLQFRFIENVIEQSRNAPQCRVTCPCLQGPHTIQNTYWLLHCELPRESKSHKGRIPLVSHIASPTCHFGICVDAVVGDQFITRRTRSLLPLHHLCGRLAKSSNTEDDTRRMLMRTSSNVGTCFSSHRAGKHEITSTLNNIITTLYTK